MSDTEERVKRIESKLDYVMDNVDILIKAHIDRLRTQAEKEKRIDEIQAMINEYRRKYENI